MNTIKEMSANKNVVVISHRLGNVVPADNIYYMEDGEVKESGTHERLMAEGGGYAALYKMQKTLEEGYNEFSAWRENRQSGVRADGEARA